MCLREREGEKVRLLVFSGSYLNHIYTREMSLLNDYQDGMKPKIILVN